MKYTTALMPVNCWNICRVMHTSSSRKICGSASAAHPTFLPDDDDEDEDEEEEEAACSRWMAASSSEYSASTAADGWSGSGDPRRRASARRDAAASPLRLSSHRGDSGSSVDTQKSWFVSLIH